MKRHRGRDPQYKRAYAELARVYEFQTYSGYTSRAEGLRKARAAAERAIALDPTEAWAHLVLGILAREYDWDWSAADRHSARAIELNPGLSNAYRQRAWLLMRLGRSEEALRLAKRGVELDPVSLGAHNDLGAMYSLTGQWENAMAKVREALQLEPGHPVLLGNLAFHASSLNRHEEAIRLGEQAVDSAPEFPHDLGMLAGVHARAGQRERAEQVLAQLQALPEVSPFLEAGVHAGLGNREQVLRLLE